MRRKMNQRELRSAFWEDCAELGYAMQRIRGYRQNDYPPDVRMRWCDYVDMMHRDGNISDKVAHNATL